MELPPLPVPGASPRDIRAALWPEYRAEFDESYRRALREAEHSLDLNALHEVIEIWRRRAVLTRDRSEHRRAVRQAVALLTGEAPPEDEPVEVTEARL